MIINRTVSYLALLASTAFAPGETGWKLDADGRIEMKDGNPVYIDSSGKEMTVEHNTISRLNAEAKKHREDKEAAETKLKSFEGLDAETARKAIETVGKIDAKKLIDAGEVDKVRDAIKNEFTGILSEKDRALAERQAEIDNMKIGNIFSNSEFIRDRIAVPRDMLEASLRNNFKIEDGKIVAYGRDGNRLLSPTRTGEYANPDEALELLVTTHPQKDVILRAPDSSGTGNGGGGGGRGGARTIRRADLDKMQPAQAGEAMAKVRAGEMQLVD